MDFNYNQVKTHRQKTAHKYLLTTHSLNSIVNLFVTTFLVAHIYTFSTDLYNYLFNVSIYSIAYYLGYGILYLLFSFIVEKTNRIIIYKISIVVKTALVIFFIFFGQDLAKLLVLAGAIIAVGDGLYYSSYSVIRQEMIRKSESSSFSSIFFILSKIIEVVCPIILGALIDIITFSYTAIIVLVVCIVQIVFASFIHSLKPEGSKFGLFEYFKILKEKKDIRKRLGIMYFIAAIYGVTYLSATLLNICIMLEYGSSFSLGLITGLISAGTILVIVLMNKFTIAGKRPWLFVISAIAPIIAGTVFAISYNKISIIVLNAVLLLSAIVHQVLYDAHRNSTLKEIGLYDQIAEHHAIIESSSGASRAVFYALTILVASFKSFLVFKIFTLVAIILCAIVHICLLVYEKNFHNNKQKVGE